MKKLDLHVHTIKTVSDHDFTFSMEALKNYIETLCIDGIAITNHNIFDAEQYNIISKELDGICTVLPGIEINLGCNGFGHILCITEADDIDDFSDRCNNISAKIKTSLDKVSYEELKQIFVDMERYLWIPHYDKKPRIDDAIIDMMSNYILCGETGSVKKFIYRQKDEDSLIPVYFSDLRPTENLKEFPTRQTYFDIDEVSVGSIKRTLLDRRHVSLTEQEGNSLFYVLPNLPASTGLNVIMGGRSSGKTYTLNQICANNDNVKYIKQFALIETNPEKEAREFTNKIAQRRNDFIDEYFKQFKAVIDSIKDISLIDDEASVENYITSLIKYAKETDRADMFAKCALYSENQFPARKLDNIIGLVESVEKLLNAREYKELIETYIKRSSLIALHNALIHQCILEKRKSLEEKFVNDIVAKIKRSLRYHTAVTVIPDVNFYECQMNRIKVRKFNELATMIKKEEPIYRQEIEGFVIQAKKRAFKNARELKDFSGKQSVAFSQIMNEYENNPFQYLQGLRDMDVLAETDYYKYYSFVDFQILNRYGFPISGGERAEFNLLQEINDAHHYDILLIDEPESSFDNIFLKDRVNHIIKELAKKLPVFLVTHNNTVGASIKPDYIIYTQRVINKTVSYERYYGLPSSKELISFSGNRIKNIQVMLDCLEAGEETYNERKNDYDLLKS